MLGLCGGVCLPHGLMWEITEIVTNSFLTLKCDFEAPPMRRWSLSLPLSPGWPHRLPGYWMLCKRMASGAPSCFVFFPELCCIYKPEDNRHMAKSLPCPPPNNQPPPEMKFSINNQQLTDDVWVNGDQKNLLLSPAHVANLWDHVLNQWSLL